MPLTFTILLLFIGLRLYIHGPLLTNSQLTLPTNDQYQQNMVKNTKSDTKYSKLVNIPPYALSLSCAVSSKLAQHLRCYATHPKPLPTCPQHSLVAHPRAMLGGHGVLVDFELEFFVLLRNF